MAFYRLFCCFGSRCVFLFCNIFDFYGDIICGFEKSVIAHRGLSRCEYGILVNKRIYCLRGELSVGLGLGIYNDNSDTEVGLGLNYKLDVELMLSRSIGIGIEGLSQTCYFKKPDGFELPDDEYYGYRQLGVMLGLRVYY